MLVRIRWFVIGAATSLGAVAYVAGQLRRARERLTPGNLARGGARSMADMLDHVADRVAPSAGTNAP
jgi:hypothetical protein